MRGRLLIAFLCLGLLAAACADPGVVGGEDLDPTDASAPEISTTVTAEPELTEPETATTATTAGSEGITEVGPATDSGDGDTSRPPTAPDESDSGSSDTSTSTTRPSKEPERVPDDTTPPLVMGETPPDLLSRIVADAADRAGVVDSELTVIRDEFVVWNDGSLGCPEPGQMYTQALVDGYWVVLKAGDVEYDYRANTEGDFFACEG
jgi:hypothetical protein